MNSDPSLPHLATISQPVYKVARYVVGVLTIIAGVATYAVGQFTDAPMWVPTIATWTTWLVGAISTAIGAKMTHEAVYPVAHVEQMIEDFLTSAHADAPVATPAPAPTPVPSPAPVELDVPQVPGGTQTAPFDPGADAVARNALQDAARATGLI